MRLQEAEQLLGDRPKIRSVLLALTGTGWPAYAPALSAKVAALGMLVFACTPDQVPEPMATVLRRQDIAQWAANRDIKLIRADG